MCAMPSLAHSVRLSASNRASPAIACVPVRAVDRQWSRRHCRMQSCEEKHEIALSRARSSDCVRQPSNVLAFQFYASWNALVSSRKSTGDD